MSKSFSNLSHDGRIDGWSVQVDLFAAIFEAD